MGIGFLNYGRQELNEMAKDNHWLEVNDVMVAFNLIGRQKHNVHCHNDVIIFDKSDDEKGECLNLLDVEKNIFAACICEKINKGRKCRAKDIEELFHFTFVVLYREKKTGSNS